MDLANFWNTLFRYILSTLPSADLHPISLGRIPMDTITTPQTFYRFFFILFLYIILPSTPAVFKSHEIHVTSSPFIFLMSSLFHGISRLFPRWRPASSLPPILTFQSRSTLFWDVSVFHHIYFTFQLELPRPYRAILQFSCEVKPFPPSVNWSFKIARIPLTTNLAFAYSSTTEISMNKQRL